MTSKKNSDVLDLENPSKSDFPPMVKDIALLKELVALCSTNQKVSAIQIYRMATGLGLQVASNSLMEWWYSIQQRAIDPATYSEICCYHCFGACGRKREFLAEYGTKLWDAGNSSPLGLSCGSFVGPKTHARYKRPVVKFDDGSYYKIVSFEKGILAIQYGEQEAIIELLSSDDGLIKFNDLLKTHLESGKWKFHGFSEARLSMIINKVQPNPGEKWDDYCKRATEEIRAKRSKIMNTALGMSYDEAMSWLEEYFAKSKMSKTLKQFPTFVAFIQAYFPDQEPNEIVLSIMREIDT